MGSVSNSNPLTPNSVFKDCSQGICSIYCPQWCSIIYSPPPPSFILGDDNTYDDDDSSSFQFSPLIIAVIGILASTFILVTSYTIFSRFCRLRGGGRTNDPTSQNAVNNNELAQVSSSSSGLDETLIKSITVCKYKKSGVLVEGSDCSVCLSEFEENENLRLLPKCNHAFHLPCIDTWLKSHSTCPLCRSNISFTRDSNPTILMEAPASMNMNALEYQQRGSDVVIVIQSSETSTTQHEDVAISFGDEVLITKWPVEDADADDGENIEELDGNVRRVYVSDILNESEHDLELERDGSDMGSSRGTEGEESEENGKGIRVVNMVKRCASTGRSMFTRYGSSKGMDSVLPN